MHVWLVLILSRSPLKWIYSCILIIWIWKWIRTLSGVMVMIKPIIPVPQRQNQNLWSSRWVRSSQCLHSHQNPSAFKVFKTKYKFYNILCLKIYVRVFDVEEIYKLCCMACTTIKIFFNNKGSVKVRSS